jgi:modification target Cys-rich repeat protein
MRGSRYLVAVAMAAAFSCGGKLPGTGGGLPTGGHDLPGGGTLPGGLGGASGEVDPNTCGNYAASDAGRKLHDFLAATKDLEKVTNETVQIVRTSCKMMGNDLGMSDVDFPEGMEAKDVCAKVWGQIHDNMKVAIKPKATLGIKYKPAVCRVDIDAQAKLAAECEGKAAADVGASCSGTCHGRCDGTCAGKAGTGGSGGECNGECKGTCHGSCEGHADVKASAECRSSAQVHASVNLQCTEPELTIQPEAKVIVDKAKAEMTLKALRDGLPKLLSVKARLEPLQAAVETWATSAKELKDMGPKFVNSFKDQALCITGQIAAAASMIGHIQANVSVSVSVSAEASGTVGGG